MATSWPIMPRRHTVPSADWCITLIDVHWPISESKKARSCKYHIVNENILYASYINFGQIQPRVKSKRNSLSKLLLNIAGINLRFEMNHPGKRSFNLNQSGPPTFRNVALEQMRGGVLLYADSWEISLALGACGEPRWTDSRQPAWTVNCKLAPLVQS